MKVIFESQTVKNQKNIGHKSMNI